MNTLDQRRFYNTDGTFKIYSCFGCSTLQFRGVADTWFPIKHSEYCARYEGKTVCIDGKPAHRCRWCKNFRP